MNSKNFNRYLNCIFTLFFYLAFPVVILCQSLQIDSLKSILENSSSQKRIDILNQLSTKLVDTDQILAMIYAKEADSLSKQLNYPKGEASALFNIGIMNKNSGENSASLLALKQSLSISQDNDDDEKIGDTYQELGIVQRNMGNYDSALIYLNNALQVRTSLNNILKRGNSMKEIGNVYFYQDNFTQALEAYFQVSNIWENIDYVEGKAHLLNNIGLVYMYLEKYDEALKYIFEGLELKKQIDATKSIANSYNNIGLVYQMQGKPTESIEAYNDALAYLDTITDKSTISTIQSNLCEVYRDMGRYDEALNSMKKILLLKKQMGEKAGVTEALLIMSEIYRLKSDYKQAIYYGTMAYENAINVKAKRRIQLSSQNLYLSYELMGDFKNAIKYLKISQNYSDSLINVEQSRELGRLEAQYIFDKEKAESIRIRQDEERLQEIKTNRDRILILSGFGILIIIIVSLVLYFKNLGKKNKIISQQNQQLESNLQALNESHDLIKEEKKKTEIANSELQTKSKELEKFNTAMLDREMRIIELKKEVNKLAKTNVAGIPYPEVEDI